MRSACLYGSSLGLCWAQIVPRLGQCWAILGLCWAHLGLMLGQVGPMCWAMLGPSWAYVGPSWAHLGPMLGPCGPMLGLCWPTLSHLGTYVGAMFRPSMLKRSTWPNMGTTCAQHRPRLLPYRQALRILPASVQHSPPPTHPRRTPGLLKRDWRTWNLRQKKALFFTVFRALQRQRISSWRC